MKKRKLLITRILSVLLLSALLCGMIFKPAVVQAQEQLHQPVTLNVVSETESAPFDGYFLVSDQKLYVADETLKRMGAIEESAVIGTENVSVCFERDDLEVYIRDGEEITYGGTVYYPFVLVLDALRMRASFSAMQKLVVVEQRKDVSQLESVLKNIYSDCAYNMSYWQNQKFFYKVGQTVAITADILKNYNFISYLDGAMQTERYQEVFWRMLLPDKIEDQIVYLDESDAMIDLVSKCAGIEEELSNFDTVAFFGDWDEKKEIGLLGITEGLRMWLYLHSMQEIDASYTRGLELILTQNTSNMNKKLYRAGTDMLSVYKGITPPWEAALTSVIEEGQRYLEGDLEEYILKTVFKVESYACDYAGIILDKVLNTQEQIDATLMAQCCLEIQKKCGDYYRCHRKELHTDNKEEYTQTARNLRDVMTLYLRAGIVAYRAVAIDDDLKAAAEYTIGRMNKELETLASCQEPDFSLYTDNKATERQIIDSKANKDSLPEQITVQFDWDGTYTNGELIQLDVYVEGTQEDGSTNYITCSAPQAFAADGALIGEIQDNSTSSNGSIKVVLHKTNGRYQFHVTTMDEGMPTNDISNAGLKITLRMDGLDGENSVEEISLEDNVYRSYTGVWFWGIAIDKGVVMNSDGLPE